MSRETKLIKNTLIISIGTICPKLASLITLPLFTAYLSTQEYGTFDLINTLSFLFVPLATLQIQSAAFRYLIEQRTDNEAKKKTITNILIFLIPISLVALVGLFFILFKISFLTRILICAYFFLDAFNSALGQIARGMGRNLDYSISGLITSFVNVLLVCVFIFAFHSKLDGILLSLTLSTLISIVFLTIRTKYYLYIDFSQYDRKYLKELLKYSFGMVPNTLSQWVMNLSDRLIVTAFLGPSSNAIYAVANKIPSLFSLVQTTFSMGWLESASLAVNDCDSSEYYSRMFDTIFCLMTGLMALLISSTPVVFTLLIRGNYDEAYSQMPILYMGVYFSVISVFFGGIYVAHKKTKNQGITTTVAAAVNLVINLLLVNHLGIYAASISTMVSFLFLCIYRMIHIQTFQPIKYNFWKIGAGILILSGMGWLCYQQMIIFNVLNIVIAVAVFAIFNKSLISHLIKRKKSF